MDWQKLQLAVKLTPSRCALNKYGGGTIPNLGSATLKITYHGRSKLADFKILDNPNSPSIIRCTQALELGLITLNVNSLNVRPPVTAVMKNKITATGKLMQSDVLKSYGDCFDKIVKFPGEWYKIKLIEDAKKKTAITANRKDTTQPFAYEATSSP